MALILYRPLVGKVSVASVAKRMATPCVPLSTTQMNRSGVPKGHDTVIRWGCSARTGIRNCINSPEAIHEVNNKLEFRRKLQGYGLCPQTWFNESDIPVDVVYPLVVRPASHAQGKNFYVAKNEDELHFKLDFQVPGKHYYISKLIPKTNEYRVFIVQGRVMAVTEKFPGNPEDVAWNIAQGGRIEHVPFGQWPLKAVKKSVEAFLLSSLDFGAVDVITDAEGNAYVLEINSAPTLKSEYREGLMAKCLDWIIQKGKDRIPMTTNRGGWRKFIHPAVSDQAILV